MTLKFLVALTLLAGAVQAQVVDVPTPVLDPQGPVPALLDVTLRPLLHLAWDVVLKGNSHGGGVSPVPAALGVLTG